MPENRWDRVDIKTVGLLPNVLAKQKAKAAGAQEAWFVDTDGNVKEGGSSNAWIVTRDGELVDRARPTTASCAASRRTDPVRASPPSWA